MRVIFILVAICTLVVSSVSTHAEGAANIAGRAAACYERSAALMDKHSKESGKAQEEIDKLGTNYPALCEYGRKVGTPLLERHLVEHEARRSSGCWDQIDEKVLAASKKILGNYKKEVENDCKKAGTQPASAQGGSGCVVETKAYENGARRSDNLKEFEKLECVKVANKCGFKIEFSVTITGSYKPRKGADSVDPGKVGKICGSNERESLSYSGWRRWGTSEPLRH